MNFSAVVEKADIEYCRKVARRTGPNYYFATRYYPKKVREATWCFYAFVRESDQIVDGNIHKTNQEKINALGTWASDWQKAYETGESSHASQRAAAAIWHKYQIPFSYTEDFLASMAADIDTNQYQSYDDLRTYMHGSASVIGTAMAHIIGFVGDVDEVLQGAARLGEAMQMANFLRDVGEDYIQLGRIYLPVEDLEKFKVTEEMIAKQQVTPEFRELMKFEIARTRELYRESLPYIESLHESGQFPVLLASQIYLQILDYIEQSDYQVLGLKKQQPNLLQKAKIELELRRNRKRVII